MLQSMYCPQLCTAPAVLQAPRKVVHVDTRPQPLMSGSPKNPISVGVVADVGDFVGVLLQHLYGLLEERARTLSGVRWCSCIVYIRPGSTSGVYVLPWQWWHSDVCVRGGGVVGILQYLYCSEPPANGMTRALSTSYPGRSVSAWHMQRQQAVAST